MLAIKKVENLESLDDADSPGERNQTNRTKCTMGNIQINAQATLVVLKFTLKGYVNGLMIA
jgi:hypothetical protein